MFQLGLNFFGLSLETAPQTRKNLFKQIHEIVFHGQGGYDWDTVYNMPIRYRDFIYNQIRDHYEKQNKAAEKQHKSIKTNKPVKPNINPTYTAKAPRK